jgi:hypothetical protein
LIELRFLPSRRRPRDPAYFEQLKSMILPGEGELPSDRRRVAAQQDTFEIPGGQAEFDKEKFADTPSPSTVLKGGGDGVWRR